MKMTVSDRPCIPAGPYVGRFVGTSHQDTSGKDYKPATGRDGQPMPPGLIWSWEITEGAHAGQIADRMTGKQPTPKSTCGAMLSALVERPIRIGDEIDPDTLIGTLWRFHVEAKESGRGTCVSIRGLVRARDLESTATSGTRPRTVAELPGPPPDDDDEPDATDDDDKPSWWIRRAKGMKPELVDYVGLLEFVRGGADPHKDRCCPANGTKWLTIVAAVPEAAQVVPIL